MPISSHHLSEDPEWWTTLTVTTYHMHYWAILTSTEIPESQIPAQINFLLIMNSAKLPVVFSLQAFLLHFLWVRDHTRAVSVMIDRLICIRALTMTTISTKWITYNLLLSSAGSEDIDHYVRNVFLTPAEGMFWNSIIIAHAYFWQLAIYSMNWVMLLMHCSRRRDYSICQVNNESAHSNIILYRILPTLGPTLSF